MTALPVVPNVVKVAVSGTVGPQNWANIMHAQWTGTTPSASILNALGTDIEALWASEMKAFFSSDVVLTGVELTDLTTTSGAQGGWTGSVPGTNSGTILPGNAAVLVNFPSSFRYRGGHPRLYLPPLTTTEETDSAHWVAATVASLQTNIGLYLASLYSATSGGCTLAGQCAVSYVSTAVNPTPPHRRTTPLVMPIPQGTATVEARIASQRRRIGRK